MVLLFYLYFLNIIGYFFLYLHYKLVETEYIIYIINSNTIFKKINSKFEIFDPNELGNLKQMNMTIDRITL